MLYKKNARVATQADFANWNRNKDAMKAKGYRLVREQGNWILLNLQEFLTEKFWKAWRTKRAEMKAKGYNVAKVFDHWIAY